MASETKHIALLDGFRAMAIILVLLVHTKLRAFQFGWIGVPMFFVLSGFLITRILLNSKTSNNYFKAFYFRRVLRIFPIYYLVLFLVYWWGLSMGFDVSQFNYYLLYLQSFTISNNIQPVFSNGLMGHTWSLSVEEIFYLVWPAIVYLTSKRGLLYICFSILGASFIFKFFQLSQGGETQSMLSLFGNLDCLMAGSLLSLYSQNYSRILVYKHKVIAFVLALFSLFFALVPFFFEDATVCLGAKIGLSISITWLSFLAIMYLLSHSPPKLLSAFLGNKFMLYTGKISYGIYLYHVPVYMFVSSFLFHYKIFLHSVLEIVLEIVLSFFVASISWYFIEKPLLNLKHNIVY